MSLKSLSAALLGAAFAFVMVAQPLYAQPPRPKACCGPSCPEPSSKKAPVCCQIAPAQAPAAAVAAPAPRMVVVVDVSSAPILADSQAASVLSSGSDRSPPRRRARVFSGLSPPRLA